MLNVTKMDITINIGSLSSLNSLVYYFAPKLEEVRQAYRRGETPNILLDFRNIKYGNINIGALTSLVSILKRLREFVGKPIPATINWDPKLQGFLADIDFFGIVSKYNLIDWQPSGIIGGYRTGQINPNTKLVYYADTSSTDSLSEYEIGLKKADLKQKIAPNFLLRCANLFYGLDKRTEEILTSTSLELIVNSLLHGEDIAFVGLQRSHSRITISVCDTGIGFSRSLSKAYLNNSNLQKLPHAEAIFIGSLIQKNVHGLRLAIQEVLNLKSDMPTLDFSNDGWVIISSYGSEIRWQKRNWLNAISHFDSTNISVSKPNIYAALGPPSNDYHSSGASMDGYWRNYPNYLVGTRITFEVLI